MRTQYNANEQRLSAGNVAGLKLQWSADLGAGISDEPIVATNVLVNGANKTVAYIGAENGMFYALDATTGKTLWSRQLGTITTSCQDLPNGVFGITATATFDKNTNRVYVADGNNDVHALDMQTGQEAAGWPINIASSATTNHVYGALTYNPANGLLYASTAALCDANNWNGVLAAIDTRSASIAATFYPGAPYYGGGIWGMGGVSIDPATNNLYAAVGNTERGPKETSAYGEHLVQLDPMLHVLASDDPGVAGNDADFGGTPMLWQAPGCPQEVSTKDKYGGFFTWKTASIGSGSIQDLKMAKPTEDGQFIGVTAYSPATNLIYVGDPYGANGYASGIVALKPESDCTLGLAWQHSLGATPAKNDNDTPMVANGVLYFDDGDNGVVYAIDASSGMTLWSSGSTIHGPVLTGPTVDGMVFVSSWDHHLYAFGL